MELFFSREEMTKVLNKCGYTVEQVVAWYHPITSMANDDEDEGLKAISMYIAYRERPEELNKEKPMLLNLYSMEDAFACVVKDAILNKLF